MVKEVTELAEYREEFGHRDTETHRHRGVSVKRSLHGWPSAGAFLCVFVSLWLFILRVLHSLSVG